MPGFLACAGVEGGTNTMKDRMQKRLMISPPENAD